MFKLFAARHHWNFNRPWPKVARALVAVAVLCVPSVSQARVRAQQSPIHPVANEPVQLTARVTGDVQTITLTYQRYALSRDSNGRRRQDPVGPPQALKTCSTVEPVTQAECSASVPAGFPDGSLVQFTASATYKNGHQEIDEFSFAAGKYPWPNDPIPIRQTGPAKTKLDVVLIPDTDLTMAEFLGGLHAVVYQLYFKYPMYGGTETINHSSMYNFYYSGQSGNFKGDCVFVDPPNMPQLTAVGDAVAFLHKATMRDCKLGDRFSSEIDYDKTLIHESGHALFGLIDEYCCDSYYAQQSINPNVWATLAACQADAPNVNYPASYCRQLTKGTKKVNFWRIDPVTPSPGCIMGNAQHNDLASTHLNADMRRVLWRFQKCLNGSCF